MEKEQKTKINNDIDIDVEKEKKEHKVKILKNFITGNILVQSNLLKQIPYLLFLVFLGIVYITNRYNFEKFYKKLNVLEEEVKNLRSEQITTSAKLMNLSRRSSVVNLIEKYNIGLVEPEETPKIIIKDKK